MVSFQCDGCGDTVKKPKLEQHYYRCHASVACIDCSKTFNSPAEFKSHTTCISEAEKYQKSLYKGPKQNGQVGYQNGHQNGRPYTNGGGPRNAAGTYQRGGWAPRSQASGANGTPLGTPARMSPVYDVDTSAEPAKSAPNGNASSTVALTLPATTPTPVHGTSAEKAKDKKKDKKRKAVAEVEAIPSSLTTEPPAKKAKVADEAVAPIAADVDSSKKSKKDKKRKAKEATEAAETIGMPEHTILTPVAASEAAGATNESGTKTKIKKRKSITETVTTLDAEDVAPLTIQREETSIAAEETSKSREKKNKKARQSDASVNVDASTQHTLLTVDATIGNDAGDKKKKKKSKTTADVPKLAATPAAPLALTNGEQSVTDRKKDKKQKKEKDNFTTDAPVNSAASPLQTEGVAKAEKKKKRKEKAAAMSEV